MMRFLGKEKIELFAVVGFSLGGKFALATLEAFTDKVTKVVLLAPDGIKPTCGTILPPIPSPSPSI